MFSQPIRVTTTRIVAWTRTGQELQKRVVIAP
jgi:hypothetical protein